MIYCVIDDNNQLLYSITSEVLEEFYNNTLPEGQHLVESTFKETIEEGDKWYWDSENRKFYKL